MHYSLILWSCSFCNLRLFFCNLNNWISQLIETHFSLSLKLSRVCWKALWDILDNADFVVVVVVVFVLFFCEEVSKLQHFITKLLLDRTGRHRLMIWKGVSIMRGGWMAESTCLRAAVHLLSSSCGGTASLQDVSAPASWHHSLKWSLSCVSTTGRAVMRQHITTMFWVRGL